MILVKVLENKSVIRAFGAALVVAPIVNTLVKMAMLSDIPNRWSAAMFFRIIAVGSVTNQILYVATIIIGFLMLRGNASVWKFVLALLGGYIMLQVSDFKHVKSSTITWIFFITNILTFMFVADQLVWKVKVAGPKPQPKTPPLPKAQVNTAPVATPAPSVAQAPTQETKPKIVPPPTTVAPTAAPAPVAAPAPEVKATPKPAYRVIPKVRKKILFQFSGGDPWGQLMGISSQGIHIRRLAEPPADIDSRVIEISLNNGLTLRTRLARRKEHDYYFDYTSISSEEIQSLNKWLHSLSDAA